MTHVKSNITVAYTILGEVNIYRRPARRRDARSLCAPEQKELQIHVWREPVLDERAEEKRKGPAVLLQESKTLKIWLQGDGTLEEYQRRTQPPTELSKYEMEHLTAAGIDFTKDLCYYRL